jgi:transcriptional regulator with XRE-family HTH domain
MPPIAPDNSAAGRSCTGRRPARPRDADPEPAVPAGPAAPAAFRRRLGRQLRQLREARSLRLEDAAARLGVAASTLSRIETGKAPTRTSYLAVLLDLYCVDDLGRRGLLADLAREGQRPGWWASYQEALPAGAGIYLGLEQAASRVCSFSVQAIPGLLRTPGYAEAVCWSSWPSLSTDEVSTIVKVQMHRQELLHRSQPRRHFIIEQPALVRPIGSPQVMTAQLKHLSAVADSPSVTVQIAALSADYPVLSPPFTVLRFPDATDLPVACCRTATGQVIVTGDDAEVRALQRTFKALARAAMTPADSADLIRKLID